MSNEQPLAIVPVCAKTEETPPHHQQYLSQPALNDIPVYSNVLPDPLSKSHSFTNKNEKVDDLHLDPVILRDAHIVSSFKDKRKSSEQNDMTLQEKENSLFSASRLRLLQDTTMIESALDLDSLDDSSIGTNSQAGLMKIVV